MLRLSDPVRTQYQPLLCAWHDGSGGEVLGMASFGALAAALDGPGLRCTGAVLAARTHQTLHAGLMHIRLELDVGAQHDFHSFLSHNHYYHMLLLPKEAECVCRQAAREGCQNPISRFI